MFGKVVYCEMGNCGLEGIKVDLYKKNKFAIELIRDGRSLNLVEHEIFPMRDEPLFRDEALFITHIVAQKVA